MALLLCSASFQSDDALRAQAKSALEATGLKYGTTETGKNYTIVFDHPNNRRQTVYMNVNPNIIGSIITYNFYIKVWFSKYSPSDEILMRKFLGKTKKLGSFYLFKDSKNTWSIRFSVKFDATDLSATPKSDDTLVKAMKDVIYFVNAVGEETDKELNGKRDMR
jgi:hypothetical protein